MAPFLAHLGQMRDMGCVGDPLWQIPVWDASKWIIFKPTFKTKIEILIVHDEGCDPKRIFFNAISYCSATQIKWEGTRPSNLWGPKQLPSFVSAPSCWPWPWFVHTWILSFCSPPLLFLSQSSILSSKKKCKLIVLLLNSEGQKHIVHFILSTPFLSLSVHLTRPTKTGKIIIIRKIYNLESINFVITYGKISPCEKKQKQKGTQ